MLKHLVRYLLRCGEYQKRKRIRNKKMKKVDLMRMAHISSNALSHLSKDEPVSIEVIGKICLALECTPNDVLEFLHKVPEEITDK